MADLGTLTLGIWGNGLNTTVVGTEPVLEAIASANDSTYLIDNSNSTHTGTAYFPMPTLPSDFDSMDTLYINVRYFLDATASNNTWDSIGAQFVNDIQVTPWTDQLTVVTGTITNTTPANSGAVQFTINATGQGLTKTEWEAGFIRFDFAITKIKGGDTVNECISAAEITGTYTSTVTAIPNKIFQLNQAVKRSRYW